MTLFVLEVPNYALKKRKKKEVALNKKIYLKFETKLNYKNPN